MTLSNVAVSHAHAQSSVTLYGLVDTGVTYTNNQHGNRNFQEGGTAISGTRWGIRGNEDLGSGLSAIFVLENGFNIANGSLGQNGREFGRQAFVGLSSKQYGAVTVGRQYDSVVDYLGPMSLTGTAYGGIAFAHPFDNDNLDNSFRVNNAVKYSSVNYNGLKFGGLYAFSNDAGGFSDNRAYSFGTSYQYGGFNFAAAYLQLNNAGSLSADNASGALTGDSTFSAGRQRTWGAGANYAIGNVTAGVIFTQTRLDNAVGIGAYASGTTSGIALPDDSAHFNNYEANLRYALTPEITLASSYTFTSGNIDGHDADWNQVNLLAVYAFSRRTNVYLMGQYQHVAGLDGTGIGAGITGLGHSSGPQQIAATVGIRHSF